MAEQAGDEEGQDGADAKPDRDADRGDQHHLDEVDRDDLPARGAEALQGRDRGALAVDEAAHGVRDADAADEQRRQADERQELA